MPEEARLPKKVKLSGGDVLFVPSRTRILNPECAGSSDYLYLLWAWSDSREEVPMEEADELFGWFTSTDRLEVLAYTGAEEAEELLERAMRSVDPTKKWELSLMRAASLDSREGMTARFAYDGK